MLPAACGVANTRAGNSARERALERGARLGAANREHDPLEPAARVEMLAHLLDLDGGGLIERESANAGTERDQRERSGTQLVGLAERRGGRLPDDLCRCR